MLTGGSGKIDEPTGIVNLNLRILLLMASASKLQQ